MDSHTFQDPNCKKGNSNSVFSRGCCGPQQRHVKYSYLLVLWPAPPTTYLRFKPALLIVRIGVLFDRLMIICICRKYTDSLLNNSFLHDNAMNLLPNCLLTITSFTFTVPPPCPPPPRSPTAQYFTTAPQSLFTTSDYTVSLYEYCLTSISHSSTATMPHSPIASRPEPSYCPLSCPPPYSPPLPVSHFTTSVSSLFIVSLFPCLIVPLFGCPTVHCSMCHWFTASLPYCYRPWVTVTLYWHNEEI